MKLFYNKIVLLTALLFSASVFAVPGSSPTLNMIADPGSVSSGDTLRFDLSFSEPVSDFFGMSLDFSYDSSYLTPLYGLGGFPSCSGTNCGSSTTDLDYYDFFGATLDVYPFIVSPTDPLTDIGFISFLVGENLSVDDILTVVTASGFYDTLAAPFDPNIFSETFDIRAQGSVTILAKERGTVPTPEVLPLMLIGLASLFSAVSLRKRRV